MVARRRGQRDARRLPTVSRIERPIGRPDVVAIVSLLVLVTLGVLNLIALGERSLALHQLLAALVGVALFLVLWRFRSASLRWLGRTCYAVSVVLLLVVAVGGAGSYGARRWLPVGSFTLQPSELAKIGLILVLAEVLGANRPWWRRLPLALVLAAIPIGLVVIEPDLSTATVLLAETVIMLVLGRMPLMVLVPGLAAIVAAAPFAEHLLHPYQVERVHAFLAGPTTGGAGWTILQAHIAVAWGGTTGQVGHPGHAVLAEYLPERETDLAFASLIEQWGLRAGILAVVAAGVLVWRLASAGRHARSAEAGLAAAGLATLVGIEVSVSVAGNLGLLPTAGVPFPLVSYGGTAAAVHIATAGLVLGLRAEASQRELWLAPSWQRNHPRLVRSTAFLVIVALGGMAGFATHLQNSRGSSLREAGTTQMTRCIPVPAPRGVIADRNGAVLARNVVGAQVWLMPRLARPGPHLAALTGLSTTALRQLIAANRDAFAVNAGTVRVSTARVTAEHLPGVLVVPAYLRTYPTGALLGAVLGWTGAATEADVSGTADVSATDVVGRAGLEQQYDSTLRGVDGSQCFFVDPAGNPVAPAPSTPAVPGASLRLTIDLGLQRKLTAVLAQAMRNSSDSGASVALDPRNGQVLAMASLPSYDDNLYGPPVRQAALNKLASSPGNPTLEHVTQTVAPPGSTFKLVVAAANMRHPVIQPDTVIPTGAAWTYDGHTFHNWGPLPPQNLTQAIAWSNDVYFYKLAAQLGADRIVDMAHRLGVGAPTGIDLPGEYGGYLGSPSTVYKIGAAWYPGSTVLLGIGQGYLDVTPLQDAVWTSAVSTGRLVTPHLGLAAQQTTDAFAALPVPAAQPLPFAGALGVVRAGMRAAVTTGTASTLARLRQPVGAKTGTAEDPSAPGATDAWLSAAAPTGKPTIEVTTYLHGGGPHGDAVTGQLTLQFLQYYFGKLR